MMLDIYDNYCDKNGKFPAVAHFLTVYIAEAHARDEWWLPESQPGKEDIMNHRTMEERLKTAKKFVSDLKFPCELVCDSFTDDLNEHYEGWPERLYIIVDGVVVYKGGAGPFGYKLAEVKDWLADKFGQRGEIMTRR